MPVVQKTDIFRAMFKNNSAMHFYEKLQSAFIEFMKINPKVDANLHAGELSETAPAFLQAV